MPAATFDHYSEVSGNAASYSGSFTINRSGFFLTGLTVIFCSQVNPGSFTATYGGLPMTVRQTAQYNTEANCVILTLDNAPAGPNTLSVAWQNSCVYYLEIVSLGATDGYDNSSSLPTFHDGSANKWLPQNVTSQTNGLVVAGLAGNMAGDAPNVTNDNGTRLLLNSSRSAQYFAGAATVSYSWYITYNGNTETGATAAVSWKPATITIPSGTPVAITPNMMFSKLWQGWRERNWKRRRSGILVPEGLAI
jgi:hypothetical protein